MHEPSTTGPLPQHFPIPPTATNVTSYTIHLTSGHDLGPVDIDHGPLNRLQFWLFMHREDRASIWLGNRISHLRYWLWRLCR